MYGERERERERVEEHFVMKALFKVKKNSVTLLTTPMTNERLSESTLTRLDDHTHHTKNYPPEMGGITATSLPFRITSESPSAYSQSMDIADVSKIRASFSPCFSIKASFRADTFVVAKEEEEEETDGRVVREIRSDSVRVASRAEAK